LNTTTSIFTLAIGSPMARALFFLRMPCILLVAALCSALGSPDPTLPVILIDTHGGEVRKTPPLRASLTVRAGQAHSTHLCRINIRGHSSSYHPKKPLKIELHDPQGKDLSLSLLGMPPDPDWILYPSFTDKTFVRDVLACELWRAMGYYAPRSRYTELFIRTNSSGESYQGIYVLKEKIKRGENRLALAHLKKGHNAQPEIAGGYIFKKDRLNKGELGFATSQGILFAYEEPKEREITSAQGRWLTTYLNRFEQALFGPSFCNPDLGYGEYLDVDSFIDYHWLVELSKNMDGFSHSVFFHKDREGKLTAGPVWDWDLSFGNYLYPEGSSPQGWRWKMIRQTDYQWYGRLFQCPEFAKKYQDRWAQLRASVFAASNILARIDILAAQVAPAAVRNRQRWPVANESGNRTYQDEVDALKNWVLLRLAWIDKQMRSRPEAVSTRPS
jgi:hypothetical protein